MWPEATCLCSVLALSSHSLHKLHKKRNILTLIFKVCQVSKLSSHLPDAIIHCLLSQKIMIDNLSGHFGELSDNCH